MASVAQPRRTSRIASPKPVLGKRKPESMGTCERMTRSKVVLEWELKALPCAALLLDEETEDEEWAPTADDEAEEPVEEYDEGDAVTENGDDAASPQLCPSADVELLDELAGAEDEAEDETDDEFAASEEDDEEPAEEYDELDAEPEEEDEEEEEDDEEEDNEEELV